MSAFDKTARDGLILAAKRITDVETGQSGVGSTPYATFAAALAAVPVGGTFTTDVSGPLLRYDRVADAPGYANPRPALGQAAIGFSGYPAAAEDLGVSPEQAVEIAAARALADEAQQTVDVLRPMAAFAGADWSDIPSTTTRIRGASFDPARPGVGGAEYAYDPAVDAAYVAAHPRSSFLSGGRGFKLVVQKGVTLAQLGADPTGVIDASAVLVEACQLGVRIDIPKSQTYAVAQNTTISALSGVTIKGRGGLKIAPGITLRFENCPDIEVTCAITGNVELANTVTAAAAIDGTTSSITVADASQFVVGNSIQTYRSVVPSLTDTQPVDCRTYRGTITAIAGNVLTLANDTGIGGDIAAVVAGQRLVALVATNRYCYFDISNCDRPRLSGQIEVNASLTNCRDIAVGRITSVCGYLALYFCCGGSVASVTAKKSIFYGFGVFKSRSISFGPIKSDRARFGGMVCKANYDCHFLSVKTRRSGVYGVQVRDDTGTVPSNINPDLQATLANSCRVTFGTVQCLNDQRGFWLDGNCDDIVADSISVIGTLGEGSFLHEQVTGTHIRKLHIEDHLTAEVAPVYYAAWAPMWLTAGSGLTIDQLSMKNCRHPSLLIFFGAAFSRLTIHQGSIEGCTGIVDIGNNAHIRINNLEGRNPPVDQQYFVRVVGGASFVEITGLKWSSNNGFKLTESPISIQSGGTGEPSNIRVMRSVIESGVVFAAIYTNSNGANIEIDSNTILCASSLGVTVRGNPSKLRVHDNFIQGPATRLHKTSFTATDYILAELPLFGSVSWDPPSIPNLGQAFVDITVTGASLGSLVELSSSAASSGLLLRGEVQTSNSVRAYYTNLTGSAVDLAARTIRAKVTAYV